MNLNIPAWKNPALHGTRQICHKQESSPGAQKSVEAAELKTNHLQSIT